MNRSPTSAVKEVTPEEAWSGNKPSVHYFRVFGCIAHVHIPDKRRSKLDDKSEKCIMLGVSEESKAYRLYNLVSKKVIISRDIFVENEKWERKRSNEKIEVDVLEWGDEEEIRTQESEEGGNAEIKEVNGVNAEIEEVDRGGFNSPSGDLNANAEGSLNPAQGRNRREPSWMQDYVSGEGLLEEDDIENFVMFTALEDPACFKDAFKSLKWREAMKLEIKAIEENETWELTTLPKRAKKIGVKWVYKTKLNEKGEVDKFKACLVAKGYS